MADHNDVPVVATGDWIDAAFINQYWGDNFRAIYQGYANVGSMAYAADANTIAELVKPAVDAYLKMSSAGVPSYVPAVDVGVPTGVVLPFGAATVPSGFLLCDGSAISRTTYARLFASIGTAWGVGDGSTTFNLPDGKGRAFIGAGTGSGLTARTLGTKLGEESHALIVAEITPHEHQVTVAGGGVQGVSAGAQSAYYPFGSTTYSTTSIGSGAAHNTMQPWFVGNWIIKD
jgi:microcystin-dependent protein